MSPFVRSLVQRSLRYRPDVPSAELRQQWTNPGDVFSVLLILGGDVVGRALAQITGPRLPPPSFSFGWVAYSVIALVSALGENKLMPEPDCKCYAINGKSGYSRSNSSWVIGRIVRDFDKWKSKEVDKKLEAIIDEKWQDIKTKAKTAHIPEPERPRQAGLCISIYKPTTNKRAKRLLHDSIYFMGFFVAFLQLGIAAIPCGVYGDWGILMVTMCGICLSWITAGIPQWRNEKWACRHLAANSNKKVVLTRGNGSQHAIVVLPAKDAFDLEDLAGGQLNVNASISNLTRITISVLTVLWVLLLITAAGLKDYTWFLLAVGSVGIFYNSLVAGWRRSPGALGVPLEFVEVIGKTKVMPALCALEEKYPYLGASLLTTFFPGELGEDEKEIWNNHRETAKSREEARLRGIFPSGIESTAASPKQQ